MHVTSRNNDVFMTTAAVVSALGSFSVVLTAIVFPSMRNKKFTQLIFIISLCDMLGNLFAAFGFPPNDSPLCPIQGALRTFFYRASWIWTTVLAYQLFCTVCFGVIGISKRNAHLFTWSISVLLLVLPFSTNEYGQDDEISTQGWCSIRGNTLTAGIWLLITSQIPVALTILLSFHYVVQMNRYVSRHLNDISKHPQITKALDNLWLYPIAMIIAWTPATIYAPLINFRGIPINETTIFFMGVTEVWGGFYGLGLAFIFYLKNEEAKLNWRSLFTDWNTRLSLRPTMKSGLTKTILDPTHATNDQIFFDNDDENYNYYTGSSEPSKAHSSRTYQSSAYSKQSSSYHSSSFYSADSIDSQEAALSGLGPDNLNPLGQQFSL